MDLSDEDYVPTDEEDTTKGRKALKKRKRAHKIKENRESASKTRKSFSNNNAQPKSPTINYTTSTTTTTSPSNTSEELPAVGLAMGENILLQTVKYLSEFNILLRTASPPFNYPTKYKPMVTDEHEEAGNSMPHEEQEERESFPVEYTRRRSERLMIKGTAISY